MKQARYLPAPQIAHGDIVVAGVDGHAVNCRLLDVGSKPMFRTDADGSTDSFTAVDHLFGRATYVMRPVLQME